MHGERRIQYRALVRKPEGKTLSGSQGIDGCILIRILKSTGEGKWINLA
jgi:hypothetical protein